MSHPLNKSWHSPEFSCFDLLSIQYRGFYIFKKYLETLIFSTVRIKLNLKNYSVGKKGGGGAVGNTSYYCVDSKKSK